MAARRRQDRVLLPGEREGRRGFLKKGLLGGAILAVGGAAWLATRKTRPAPELGGPFQVLSAAEATVVLAAASRFIPDHWRFPGPGQIGVPRKVDAILEMADPATQKEVKRLLGLLENALAGLLLDGQFRTFTASPPEEQDLRLQAWAASRLTVRRTGFRALQKMVFAAYYASPETYGAVGYPGPPVAVTPSVVDNTVQDAERAGFRRQGDALEFRNGEGSWQLVTDPGVVRITALSITPSEREVELYTYCSWLIKLNCSNAQFQVGGQYYAPTDPSIPRRPTLTIRQFAIVLAGEAANDPSVQREIRETVRVRNDRLDGRCPAV